MWQWISSGLLCVYIIKWLKSKLRIGQINQKYVMITGCDSGFGYAIAKKLDSLGFNVIATCLTKEGANSIKNQCSGRLRTVQLNIASEEEIQHVAQEVKHLLPSNRGLWAVINNAGTIGLAAPFEFTCRKDVENVLDVNLLGMMDVNRAFLPLLRKAGGRIVNVSSIGGRFAVTPISYTISKFGVEGFSDCLRREVYSQGVSVHIMEPGFFQTGLLTIKTTVDNYRKSYNAANPEVKEYYGPGFLKKLCSGAEWILKRGATDIEPVIAAMVHAVTARYPKHRYMVGMDANTYFRCLIMMPEWMSDMIFCKLLPTPDNASRAKLS